MSRRGEGTFIEWIASRERLLAVGAALFAAATSAACAEVSRGRGKFFTDARIEMTDEAVRKARAEYLIRKMEGKGVVVQLDRGFNNSGEREVEVFYSGLKLFKVRDEKGSIIEIKAPIVISVLGSDPLGIAKDAANAGRVELANTIEKRKIDLDSGSLEQFPIDYISINDDWPGQKVGQVGEISIVLQGDEDDIFDEDPEDIKLPKELLTKWALILQGFGVKENGLCRGAVTIGARGSTITIDIESKKWNIILDIKRRPYAQDIYKKIVAEENNARALDDALMEYLAFEARESVAIEDGGAKAAKEEIAKSVGPTEPDVYEWAERSQVPDKYVKELADYIKGKSGYQAGALRAVVDGDKAYLEVEFNNQNGKSAKRKKVLTVLRNVSEDEKWYDEYRKGLPTDRVVTIEEQQRDADKEQKRRARINRTSIIETVRQLIDKAADATK